MPFTPIKFFGFLFLSLILFGCNSSKKVLDTPVETSNARASRALMRAQQAQPNPEWLNSRVKLRYDDGSTSMSASGTMVYHENELIWLQIRKLGFEVARVKITVDSFFVVDNWNREYIAEPIESLSQEVGFPVTFNLLEAALLGKMAFFTADPVKLTEGEQLLILGNESDRYKTEYAIGLETFLIDGMMVMDKLEKRMLHVKMEDYQELEEAGNFSYFRNLGIASPDVGNVNIELKFNQVKINVPKTVKFKIPSRFQRVRL